MPKLTSPVCTQHFKLEQYDNTHYPYFEKNLGPGDKSFGVTTFYQQGISDQDNESISGNSAFSENSSGGKKKGKNTKTGKKKQKDADQKPKVVYD